MFRHPPLVVVVVFDQDIGDRRNRLCDGIVNACGDTSARNGLDRWEMKRITRVQMMMVRFGGSSSTTISSSILIKPIRIVRIILELHNDGIYLLRMNIYI